MNVIKKLGAIGTATFAFIVSASHALALDPGPTSEAVGSNISQKQNIVEVAFQVTDWILGATFAFAVIMIIVGGFRYITSAGESQTEAAKEQITQAVIGLVIILLAFVIASTLDRILVQGAATR